MLNDIHETFREALHQEIWKWIKGLATREDNVGIFARGMADTEGAPSYKFPPTIAPDADYSVGSDKTVQAIHTPDIPFRHEDDALPGTIIEVAYSQTSKDLRRLAYTYLVDSNAAVQAVFGFSLKDGSTQRATFSVWQSKDEDNVLSMVTQHYNQVYSFSLANVLLTKKSRNFVVLTESLQVIVRYVSDLKTSLWMIPQDASWATIMRSFSSLWTNSAVSCQKQRRRQKIERRGVYGQKRPVWAKENNP
jgi:hypothetical protein